MVDYCPECDNELSKITTEKNEVYKYHCIQCDKTFEKKIEIKWIEQSQSSKGDEK